MLSLVFQIIPYSKSRNIDLYQDFLGFILQAHCTITKHGIPVAQLVPVVPLVKPDIHAVIDELKTFAKGHIAGGMTIREMIEGGGVESVRT